MRYGHTIPLPRLTARVGFVLAASLAFGTAVGADKTPVRQQIQFSATGEALDSPKARSRDDLLSKRFEFLDRGNSISGVVQPLVAPVPMPGAFPSLSRNARMLEALDHKKNWVYVRSEDLDRTETLDEMLGVKDSDNAERKPRTALENFLEDRGQAPRRERGRETRGEWKRKDEDRNFSTRLDYGDRTNADSRLDKPFESRPAPMTAGFSAPVSFFGAPESQPQWLGLRSSGLREPLSGARDSQNRADEFRKLLAVPGTANPLVPGFDPINLQVDTTRQSLNPVTAPRWGEASGSGADAINPLNSLTSPIGARSSLLNDPGARVLGPSSLSPAVSPPTDAPIMQPKPTILEFPKRKF